MSKKLASGHEVEPMSKEWLDRYADDQCAFHHGIVRLQPGGIFVQGIFTKYADSVYNFQFRSSDVVVMTMPRSGTTWTQEIVWTMINNPDLDNPAANQDIMVRSPEIEQDMFLDSSGYEETAFEPFRKAFAKICPGRNIEDGMNLQMAEMIPDRRVIKTHLPFSLFKPDMLDTTKVVYVARNPRDVIVSYYNLYQSLILLRYTGTLDKFAKDFMNDQVIYAPYWGHMKEGWVKKDHPNMHFTFFEDMKTDIMKELKNLNTFLGTNLSDRQLENVKQHTTFSAMKSRELPVSGTVFQKKEEFFRKGQTGDWRNTFSPELDKEVTEWIQSNRGETGIPFQ